jgi:hypothetical protein
MSAPAAASFDGRAIDVTRRSWHAVAELVLAGPQYRRSGKIRLRIVPDGFATVNEPGVRVGGTDLFANGEQIDINGRTCAELAEWAGLDAGKPEKLYHDGSDVAADAPLELDPAAVAWLARAFVAGDAALRRLDPTQAPVLWPEHFDVASTIDEVNYGVSAGDGYLAEPYAYVGPWRPRRGAFWNAPFGAARTVREIVGRVPVPDEDAGAVLAFFDEGRLRAGTDPVIPDETTS